MWLIEIEAMIIKIVIRMMIVICYHIYHVIVIVYVIYIASVCTLDSVLSVILFKKILTIKIIIM